MPSESPDVLVQRRCEVRIHRGSEAASVETARPWAARFVNVATLAAIVYRVVDMAAPAGWQLSPDPADVVNDSRTSLYLEVWEKASTDSVDVAVVFRGTNDLKDWWSNLRWFTRFIPIGWDQYTCVRREIPNIVDRAKARHGSVRMITVGHSLGGGLAQQAAYAHPEIKYAVAFDPSPVTGFRSVPKAARDANRKGIAIDRVYERGEILAYLRTLVRWMIPLSLKDPTITEIRFNVTKGDPIMQHSMVKLARRLSRPALDCPEILAGRRAS